MTAPVPRGCNGRVLTDRTTTSPLPRARALTGTSAPPRRAVWVAGWLAAAVWALGFPLVSTLETHRVWGISATAGYAGAALAAWWLPRPRARALALGSACAGAVAVPLVTLLLTGRGQSEVGVIERSGVLLVRQASPYLTDPQNVGEYTPYLPGMALFGLPRALFGDEALPLRILGDARLWCAGVFLVCLRAGVVCLRTAAPRPAAQGAPQASYRTGLAVLLASPVVALPLCVSGVDLPLAGLCCLGLALAARGRPVAAGLALAAACALKWTAWPAVAVAAALLGTVTGARAALRCAGTAVAGAVAAALPSALLAPGPMALQVLAFPAGRGDVPTPAASPLPGRLLADLGPLGWYAAVVLLLCGAVAVAATLVLRPPATVTAAADRLAAGLCVAFLLAPAGRFGYLALPVLLVVWPRLAHGHAAGREADRKAR
ncbi:glycosyltransferase 87 family protein [Streptomyces spectabilis]|uniref:glycosyltransferase 87 family protein n=1 Tax=Streptomyces spectabilis TaxID=68270 RepID=UPI00340B075F